MIAAVVVMISATVNVEVAITSVVVDGVMVIEVEYLSRETNTGGVYNSTDQYKQKRFGEMSPRDTQLTVNRTIIVQYFVDRLPNSSTKRYKRHEQEYDQCVDIEVEQTVRRRVRHSRQRTNDSQHRHHYSGQRHQKYDDLFAFNAPKLVHHLFRLVTILCCFDQDFDPRIIVNDDNDR